MLAVIGSIALFAGTLLQAFSTLRSMAREDVELFRTHANLQDDEIRARLDAVYGSRVFKRWRLARQARRDIDGLLNQGERERLRVIQTGMWGWSFLSVGALLVVLASLEAVLER